MSALTDWRRQVVEQLNAAGIDAVAAFEPEERAARTKPVTAVSLAAVECRSGGFQNYLGREEQRERYGRAVELTVGLDVYGPRAWGEDGCRRVMELLAEEALTRGLAGIGAVRLYSSGMEFLEDWEMYHLPVQCVCTACLTACTTDEGEFVDIQVKGRTV